MASQSLQVGPYDANYTWGFDNAQYFNGGKRNSYTGSVFQEAISGTQQIPADAYVSSEKPRFVTFGVEIDPDWDYNAKGAITWYLDGKKSWRAPSSVMGPNKFTQISQRIVPVEPMAIVMNLGTLIFFVLVFPFSSSCISRSSPFILASPTQGDRRDGNRNVESTP